MYTLHINRLALGVALLYIFSNVVSAQQKRIYIEPNFGVERVELIDPIARNFSDIVVSPREETSGWAERFGLTLGYIFSSKLSFQATAFGSGANGYSFFITDIQQTCSLCPIRKAFAFGTTRWGLAFGPEVTLYRKDRLRVAAFGGVGLNFSKFNQQAFSFNGQSQQRIGEFMTVLSGTLRNQYSTGFVGLEGYLKRFTLNVWYDRQLSGSFTNSFEFEGQVFGFVNRRNIVSVTIGYTFFL